MVAARPMKRMQLVCRSSVDDISTDIRTADDLTWMNENVAELPETFGKGVLDQHCGCQGCA